MTTAQKICRSAFASATNAWDFARRVLALATASASLVHWDDAYDDGWSEGHRLTFADQSYLTIDGRGVQTGDSRQDAQRRAESQQAAEHDDWCAIHGYGGCE